MGDTNLPSAVTVHQTGGRLRIRIPERKGCSAYFEELKQTLSAAFPTDNPEINPATGSVLFRNGAISPKELTTFGLRHQLFRMTDGFSDPVPWAQRFMAPFSATNRTLNTVTRGKVNLPLLVFTALLATGILEIAKGNFRSPPWYTAFWYAFGIVTSSLIDTINPQESSAGRSPAPSPEGPEPR